ncbi:MAG: hypothetical protein ACYC0Y_26135 [Pirellulales bacterium]
MRSGDPCPKCPNGLLLVYKTARLRGSDRSKRYLRCDACNAHGVEVILSGPPQRRRGRGYQSGTQTP